jgi:hypothetical protein
MNAPRLALLLAPALLVASQAACSSAAPAPSANGDVILQGSATAGALAALLADKAGDDPALAAYFDNPKDLAELPGTPIITFTWHDGQATARRQLLPRPAKAASTTGFPSLLSDLLGERSAYAQGPALTGEGYLLAFGALDTGEELFRVFTSAKSYTPDAATWAKIATGDWTTLQITSATFADDAVAASGGPYSGQAIKFCVGSW